MAALQALTQSVAAWRLACVYSHDSSGDCEICRLHAGLMAPPDASGLLAGGGSWLSAGDPIAGPEPGGLLIGRCADFLLRHHPLPSPLLGWLLLDARRHVGGPVDFSPAEAAGFGVALQRASGLVRELTGCERVYALAFGEGARHLHLHLVPRHAGDPATEAWRVADLYREVVAGVRPAVEAAAVRELVGRARRAMAGWSAA